MLQAPWSRNATLRGQAGAPPTPRSRGLLPGATEPAAAGAPPGGPAGGGGAPMVAAGSLLSLLVVWTLLGNVLVCAAIVGSRHLRAKVTHIFIVSLAVSDLLVALLVMPWKAAAEVAGYWPFGAFCSVWVAFDIMCSTASILNLCVISVDRYWAISSPFRYERKMTPRVALAMVGLAWALSILISFLPVQLNWHKGPDPRAPGTASPEPGSWGTSNSTAAAPSEQCDSSLNRTYAISSSLISFYIPVAIMIVTYTRIYRIAQVQIRRISSLERAAEHAESCRSGGGGGGRLDCAHPLHQQQQQQHHHSGLKSSLRKETKVLKTLSVIMGVFVCCWLPFFVLNCMVPFCDRPPGDPAAGLPCVSDTTFDVFVWFGWANSSLNPIIYAFNADFRKVFSRLLGCSRPCSGSPGETANLSHELISCNQDTFFFRREGAATDANRIPNVAGGGCGWGGPFDGASQISPDPEGATESGDCEGDISLGRISPLTPTCLL
ncbi:D(1B) dopamine receptor [Podarcis raffonei]|uniref:D(1B) dopamine receptor n=1 Tax=Podarcis raffonei TaxID=65483 RepID=UPI0023296E04|nr:D(1B) dopamine receptor [Podarcis raffonei]